MVRWLLQLAINEPLTEILDQSVIRAKRGDEPMLFMGIYLIYIYI